MCGFGVASKQSAEKAYEEAVAVSGPPDAAVKKACQETEDDEKSDGCDDVYHVI
jgi:hypothetical protein